MQVLDLYNYWVYVALMMVGLYAVVAKTNLVKKVIGLSLFQTGIFIFYISLGVVDGGTAPIDWPAPARFRQVAAELDVPAERREAALEALAGAGHGDHGAEPAAAVAAAREALGELSDEDAARLEAALERPYTNPLPHVLILTAIVVSVSTMAVALAIVVGVKRSFGTIEADELARIELADRRAPSP